VKRVGSRGARRIRNAPRLARTLHPLRCGGSKSMSTVSALSPTAAQAPSSTARAVRRERTILVIEDDEEMRRMLVHILSREGYEVVDVADATQALDWLGLCLVDGSLENIPALIVSDIRLPDLSGFELLEGLRCATVEVPVILITGFPSQETFEDAFELGAARVLSKPFALDDFRLSVYTVLDAWRAHRPVSYRDRTSGWTKLSP
jgi:DNA-binding NtrC family response regulator